MGSVPDEARAEGRDYEIRIRGRISDSLRVALEDFTVSVVPTETVVWAPALDQAALYGLLTRIQALGLELVEVRRSPSPATIRIPEGDP